MAKKRFSRTQSFNKRNIEKIPKGEPIVYKLKNLGGENVYTGIAKRGRVPSRLKEHLPEGPDPIRGVKKFQIKPMKSIENAEKEEKKIIQKEKPKYNK